ncbi:hypothetical protein HQ590_14925 [bacterium]|nr:hypothetical protein [bacterium]
MLFCGVKFAERIAVSLHSLRKHWTGPVRLWVTNDECEALGSRIAKDLRIHVQRVAAPSQRRHTAHAIKAMMATWPGYRQNVFIDGDTVVAGDFGELFEGRLVITRFADWQSQGRQMAKRINRWRGLTPRIDALVDLALARKWPAINTGILGWRRGNEAMALWSAITNRRAGSHMADELAMQLLYPSLDEKEYKVLDDRYNCSPLYAVHRQDARIWHLHGAKHLRREQGKEVWGPAFDETHEANVGGIRDWAGEHDPQVAAYLLEKRDGPKED